MRTTLALAIVAVLVSTIGRAQAEIQIDTARISGGEFVVSGRAAGHAQVTLDDRVSAETDANGAFSLRAAYFPTGCVARIRAGDETRDLVVAGCGSVEEAAPVAPSGRLGLRKILVQTCADPYCEVVCEAGEVIVSSYCLGSGHPTFTRRESGEWVALCPGTSGGIAGFCARL